MKNRLLLLSVTAFALLSCDKEEDTLFLEGSYENMSVTSPEDPSYSREMTFSKTGDLLIEYFVTPVGSEESCLQAYSEGTYILQGENFTMYLSASFGPDPAAFYEPGSCIPRDELVNSLDSNPISLSGTLVWQQSNNAFTVTYPCNDMIGGLRNCIGPQTYTKVD